MEVYLVGGAVRDELLGFPFHERDWVVVGATPEKMLAEGFTPVGKDFPVFLHAKTREEYALARTERKSGRGYTGFTFHTDESVTLEEDLIRRDLTINAIAKSAQGDLIDPYGGKQDIDNKILRHVSPAFAEDPVRIMRIARFAARYHQLGFVVAEETQTLMRTMVEAGEVDHLVAERVWKEMHRALAEPNPEIFIEVLRACGALARLMPELDCLWGVPQRAEYHPEIDTGVHTMMTLQQSVLLTKSDSDTRVRFAALVHDLGKGTTPADELPRHIAHEHRGLALVKDLCARLGVPKEHRDLALAVTGQHLNCHRLFELKPASVFKMLQALDALRRPERVPLFTAACKADARGRTGFESTHYPQEDFLKAALDSCLAVKPDQLIAQGLAGKALGEGINRARVSAIAALKESWPIPAS